MSANSKGTTYGYFILLLLYSVCGVLDGKTTTTVTIRNNDIRQCQNCPVQCSNNKRVQLNTYEYNKLNVLDPTMLFTRCSWQEQCSIDIALIKSIMNSTNNGELVITYSCKGLDTKRSICNTSVAPTIDQTNLIYQRDQSEVTSSLSDNQLHSLVLADIQSCSCIITGLFKIQIIDLRLPHDNFTRTLVSAKVCKGVDRCSTEHFNSSNSVQFNGDKIKNAVLSEIYLENTPNYFVMVWIQITKQKDDKKYSVNCSTIESTQPTTVTVTTEVTTSLDTSPSTIFSTTQSTQPDEDVTTVSNYLSVTPTTFTVRTSSSVSTHETPIPDANRGDPGGPEDSTFPVVGVVAPVVLVLIGSVCAAGIIMIYRRRRKRNRNMANGIVNHSYEDTTDDLRIPPVYDKIRSGSESIDSGIPETNTDYTNEDSQTDDQYNVIDNNIDDEYNKISFQQTPIPFDQSYGHVLPTNPVQNKEYDHVDGVPALDMQPYSHVNQQVLKDEAESKLQSINKPSDQRTQPRADSTYDHLALSNGKESHDFDELQGDDYSHLPSSGAVTTHTKPRRGNRDQNVIKPNGFSNTTEQSTESKDTEHAYFVLESDNNASLPQTEINTSDTAVHPYFILEPKANLPYTQIVKDQDETAEHSYFTLEPNAHSMKH